MPNFSLSIITCSLNSIATIQKSLDSICEGSDLLWQHILVDGMSTDGTQVILRDYQRDRENVQVFEDPPKGVYSALNKAVEATDSEWTIFLHSDDRLLLDLPYILSILQKSKSEVVCFGVKIKGLVTTRKYRANTFDNILFPPPHTGMVFRTSILKQHIFDESLFVSADFKQLIELKKRSKLSFEKVNRNLIEMSSGGLSTRPSNVLLSLKEDCKVLADSGESAPLIKAIVKKLSKIMQIRF